MYIWYRIIQLQLVHDSQNNNCYDTKVQIATKFKIPLIIIFLFFLWKPLEFNKVTINGLELLQLLANSNPIINVQHLYLIIIILNHTRNRYWNHSNYDNQQKLWILEFEGETWYSGHVRVWAPLLRYPSHPLLSTSAFSIPLVNCILPIKSHNHWSQLTLVNIWCSYSWKIKTLFWLGWLLVE